MLVKLDHLTPGRDEHKKYLKPPPSYHFKNPLGAPLSADFSVALAVSLRDGVKMVFSQEGGG